MPEDPPEIPLSDLISQGNQCLEAGDFERAKAAFEEAVSRDGGSVPGHAGLCQALCSLGDREGAAGSLEAAAAGEVESGHLHVFNRLGIHLRRARELDLAARAFDRAIGLGPEEPVLLYNKSLIHLVRLQLDEGIALLERALEIQPEFSEAKMAREKFAGWKTKLEESRKGAAAPPEEDGAPGEREETGAAPEKEGGPPEPTPTDAKDGEQEGTEGAKAGEAAEDPFEDFEKADLDELMGKDPEDEEESSKEG